MERIFLCRPGDLEDDAVREVTLPGGEVVALVRHQGVVRAFEGECPHQGAPLADGEVEDGVITCCLHDWSWRLDTGEPVDAGRPLALREIEVDDDAIRLVR